MTSPFVTTILTDKTVMIGNGSDVHKNGLKDEYKNIENIDIPREIDGKEVTIIGKLSFYQCTNVKSIKLPASIIEVGYAAFDVSYIEIKFLDLSLLPNLKKLCRFAFSSNRIERIKIGPSLSYCEEGVFANNKLLEEIIVDESNKWFASDYQGSFYNKKRDLLIHVPMNKSVISIPHEVKTIANMALYSSKVVSLVVPITVVSIKNDAFRGMSYLEEIIFYCSLNKIKCVLFTWTNIKSLVYMRREQVNYNIFGTVSVESITTCLQYAGLTFADKSISNKIGICSIPKMCTPHCNTKDAMNNIIIYVLLI